ncbi:hypothetical protein BZA05DRAFT_444219 [Tricharina praecox]|uniref:uncharacterized protein n=1 Tax=Tricharina praecox TaxID=43433 RepID=UPI00221EC3A3|nr:uncharacterized protein BZA05DRAFT_444219 [Tricharina praecox]KAI5853952.1 hypothetical protein BZA05DRAFT_444219 [Tricharina praecox]
MPPAAPPASSKAARPRRPETFRAGGIRRSTTTTGDLIAALSAELTDEERDIEIEASIVPSCDRTEDTNIALLCFKPNPPAYLSPLYNGNNDTTKVLTTVGLLSFDKSFLGLPQLYPTPPRREITAETTIYGYNSKIADYTSGLLKNIKRARTKKSLVIASEEKLRDIETYSIYEATRALIFFATPHRGLSTEDILGMVDAEKQNERACLVRSIDKNSEVLQSRLHDFTKFASRFRIFSFYEQKTKTRTRKLGPNGTYGRTGDFIVPVDADSALLGLPRGIETRIVVDEDHTTIVKFNGKHRTYRLTISYFWDLTDGWLLDHAGYNPKYPATSATEALPWAIGSGDLRLVKLLLNNGANLRFPMDGKT